MKPLLIENTLPQTSCVIYCRFSSKQQEGGYSIEAQRSAAIDYAKKNNLKILHIFEDRALSGTSDDRDAFQDMIRQAATKPPPFNTIIVHKLDRFARNRYDSVKYKYLLRKQGIRVVSVTQPSIGSNEPTDVLLESLLEGMDEFYSLNLARESIKGMVENVKAGFWNGGKAPFGYKKLYSESNGRRRAKLVIEPAEARIVKYVYKRYSCGDIGIKNLMTELNRKGWTQRSGAAFTKSVVEYIIRNEKYVGDTKFGKQLNTGDRPIRALLEPVTVKNSHTPIIDRDLDAKAKQILKSKSPENSEPMIHNDSYMLSSLIVCGKCGARYIGASAKGGKFHYYRCGTKSRKGKIACDAPDFNRVKLEGQITDQLKKKIITRENIKDLAATMFEKARSAVPKITQEISVVDTAIRTKEGRLQKLYETIETSKVLNADDLAPRIRELKTEIQSLQIEKEKLAADLQNSQNAKFDTKWLKAYAEFIISLLESKDFYTLKNLFRRIIKTIEVKNGICNITYRPFSVDSSLPTQSKKKELGSSVKLHSRAEFAQTLFKLPDDSGTENFLSPEMTFIYKFSLLEHANTVSARIPASYFRTSSSNLPQLSHTPNDFPRSPTICTRPPASIAR
ncbi:MAG: recombinase family protein [Candidatus Omnitrophota bacterium]